jgi:hypothetical protein
VGLGRFELPTLGLQDRCRRQILPVNPPTIKDQPSWRIYVSNCIYETYDFGGTVEATLSHDSVNRNRGRNSKAASGDVASQEEDLFDKNKIE